MPKARQEPVSPDPHALAAASFAQEIAGPNTVILFGSRATGKHRSESDMDVMLVCKTRLVAAEHDVSTALKRYFEENPPALNVQLLAISEERFSYCRRAPNHVAGQAWRSGVVMCPENISDVQDLHDGYPDSWPDVKQRLLTAQRNLRSMATLAQYEPQDQASYGFHGQQAIENSLKAWMSAAELEYRSVHDLQELAETLLSDSSESTTPAAAVLLELMEYTSYTEREVPARSINWLNKYAVTYRYGDAEYRMSPADQERFVKLITRAALAFAERAHQLTGTVSTDLET